MLNFAKSYLKNKDGQFAILTAIAAVPLLMCVTYVIDLQRAESAVTSVQNTLDAATLAAVTKGNLSKQARARYAKDHFRSNYHGRLELALRVTTTEDQVTLKAKGAFPISMGFFQA